MKSLIAFISAAAALLALPTLCAPSCNAQSMDDLNLQIHGYATQGFIYTTQNNWGTTDSSNGSAAWTEAVVNLSVQPLPKLHIGVQTRYFLLGTYGNAITLDWAEADYKVNEHFGFRVGDVKTPMGLLNMTQDIDPVHLWVLLPQSIYPLSSRDSLLDHYGGVVYGSLPLGKSFGKLEYRAFGGERVLGPNDGYFQPIHDLGISLPNGITGKIFGGTLRWQTPLPGLMVGASEGSGATAGKAVAGTLQGTITSTEFRQTFYYGRYEHNKIMFAGEYSRLITVPYLQLGTFPRIYVPEDRRTFYAMASYKLARKLTAGLYYSSYIDLQAPFTSARYQKDWAIAARYDFNPFLYAKVEHHVIDGTAIGFALTDNPNLQPDTRMTMLKLGVTF